MSLSVKARVVRVRPRGDDTYGVTLGPGPRIFWLRMTSPPNLGDLLVVRNAEASELTVRSGSATVTLLEGGEVSVASDPFQRRVVAPMWVQRVHQMVTRPLYDYQAEGAGWIASRIATGRGCILGDDPGLGKTAQVLTAVAATALTPAIVVCPPSVKRNWEREIALLRPNFRVSVVRGGRGVIPSAHFIILNYAIMKPRELQLLALRARCIVFDEAHLLKEPQPTKNHRAAVATRLAHRIGSTVLMTGTPLLNRPQELWRLLHLLDRREWDDFAEYRKRYCTAPTADERTTRSVITKHGKAKNVDELRAFAQPYMLRRMRKGLLAEKIPPKTRSRVLIELDPFDRKNYDAAERDVVSWLRKVSTDARARQATRGQAVVKLTMLRRIAALGKLRHAVKDYLTAWFSERDRPLVIFAYHRLVLEGTFQICKKLGLNIATIRGSDDDAQRQRAVDLFQGGFADVFIAPIRSSGVGLNLQRASDILCLERLWTPSLMNQAESRCHRLGQKNPVTVTYLDAKGTVDEYIARVLGAKQKLIDVVVDDRASATIREQTIETIEAVIATMRADKPQFQIPQSSDTTGTTGGDKKNASPALAASGGT